MASRPVWPILRRAASASGYWQMADLPTDDRPSTVKSNLRHEDEPSDVPGSDQSPRHRFGQAAGRPFGRVGRLRRKGRCCSSATSLGVDDASADRAPLLRYWSGDGGTASRYSKLGVGLAPRRRDSLRSVMGLSVIAEPSLHRRLGTAALAAPAETDAALRTPSPVLPGPGEGLAVSDRSTHWVTSLFKGRACPGGDSVREGLAEVERQKCWISVGFVWEALQGGEP